MQLETIKSTFGRKIVKSKVLKSILYYYLLIKTKLFFQASRNNLVAIISMGKNGHSYSAARGAKELGKKVILVTDKPQVHEMLMSNALIPIDPLAEGTLVSEELSKYKIDAVVHSIKHLLLPAQNAIAVSLDLYATGKDVGIYCNNKLAWRNKLRDSSILQPKYSSDPNFFHDRACIKKPCSGTASVGVIKLESSLVSTPESSKEIYNDGYYFEEIIEGVQFDIEGVMENGIPRTLCIIKEKYLEIENEYPPHYFLFNPPITKETEENLNSAVYKILEASKVIHGAWHVEVRVKNGKIYPIDFANRMGYERYLSIAAGQDFAQAHVNCFLKEKIKLPQKNIKYTLQFFCWTKQEREACLEIISNHPSNLYDINMNEHKIGQPLAKAWFISYVIAFKN